ncbi:MAG: hypothetical protein EXR59_00340 [Dehalococcoidia bacterium]|nr:hypothetical protein [Dehalococcoidia bacterium]
MHSIPVRLLVADDFYATFGGKLIDLTDRLKISGLQATCRGEHDNYTLTLTNSKWECSCYFFQLQSVCSHVMAVENILSEMISQKV